MVATTGIRTTQSFGLAAIRAVTTNLRLTQNYSLVALNFKTKGINNTQSFVQVALKTATTIKNTQTYVLVALFRGAGDHRLRAWTFTQDNHDFYVLNLGSIQTLVYDKWSQRWAQWKSPGINTWLPSDGCQWQNAGFNVCCSSTDGSIYQIDPTGRKDYNTTPITSVVIGGLTERFRNYTQCYMAELAVSEGAPPAGIDPTTVGITLRVGDTLNFVSAGQVAGQASGTFDTMRWYGLGLIRSPGVIFELTDTGYARRIDGLDIEIGAAKDGNSNS